MSHMEVSVGGCGLVMVLMKSLDVISNPFQLFSVVLW